MFPLVGWLILLSVFISKFSHVLLNNSEFVFSYRWDRGWLCAFSHSLRPPSFSSRKDKGMRIRVSQNLTRENRKVDIQ